MPTCAESDGSDLSLLLQGHDGDVCPDVVNDNGAIQKTDCDHVDDRCLRKAGDGRVESFEGMDHGASADIPELHGSLVASNENLVEVCAGMNKCCNSE